MASAKGNNESHCLITVGTTEFNNLMLTIDEYCAAFLEVLSNTHGIDCMTIQKGRGKYVPHKIIARNKQRKAMKYIHVIEYTSSGAEFQDVLKKSSLVISHAGAGSILESLRLNKKLFVVNNDTLMHNHQMEICRPLAKEKYLYFSQSVADFITILRSSDFSKLVPYPSADYDAFPNALDELMGL